MPVTLPPGDWNPERMGSVWLITSDGVALAQLPDRGPTVDQEAHAKAMAAAKDLLALAEAVAEHFDGTDAPLGELARRVIARTL